MVAMQFYYVLAISNTKLKMFCFLQGLAHRIKKHAKHGDIIGPKIKMSLFSLALT